MGCVSSTAVTTDLHTGKEKKKHKMGGAYPGNRRKPQAPYTPGASQFNSQGQATAHFVSYGGGNALVLQQGGKPPQPQVGEQAQFIQVTLPNGVNAGQVIHVQAPDGRINEIIVPDGFGPGSTFTVEFAKEEEKPTFGGSSYSNSYVPDPKKEPSSYPTAPVATATTTTADPNRDDGFATGFNNPNFVPAPAAAAATTASYYGEPDIDFGSYPSASDDAKPVYNTAPKY